ncbi:hypothetical protein Acr_08g0004530 [Actinidia rufa]|uniref:Uncharacterized protein n=1 Tax=Actinidia rufa TaxID=165716 RepID=A0A7J0F2D3_9ERIC|nr:hypothetical protein Acr_08g0004530 [Actinidia rufa]
MGSSDLLSDWPAMPCLAWLDAAVSVSELLTRPCLYGVAVSLPSTTSVSIWAWGCQKVLFHAGYLLSPVILWDIRRPLPLVQAFSVVIVPNSLSNGASGVTMALAREGIRL